MPLTLSLVSFYLVVFGVTFASFFSGELQAVNDQKNKETHYYQVTDKGTGRSFIFYLTSSTLLDLSLITNDVFTTSEIDRSTLQPGQHVHNIRTFLGLTH